MSDNQGNEANGGVKYAAGSFTDDKILKPASQVDRARTTVKDQGNNLVDTLPGRGTE